MWYDRARLPSGGVRAASRPSANLAAPSESAGQVIMRIAGHVSRAVLSR
jgi:hypothetical protein